MLTDAAFDTTADAVAGRRAEWLLDRPAPAGRLGISGRGLGGPVARHELPPGSWTGGRRRRDWNQIRTDRVGRQGRRGRDLRGVVRSRFEGTV